MTAWEDNLAMSSKVEEADLHPRLKETLAHTMRRHAQIPIAILVVIAKRFKQPKCLATRQWINKCILL